MQMICALLVFQSPELPDRLSDLSPWMDWIGEPQSQVVARLQRQAHRRFIKTHTPLDGLPLDPRVTYIVVARHPLDAAVSLYWQGRNIDRERVSELTGQPVVADREQSLHSWLVNWTEQQRDPRTALDSLAGVMHHVSDAWRRRSAPNVVLVHSFDLTTDLHGTMSALAHRLGIETSEQDLAKLVDAATFDRMSAQAERLAPNAGGVLKSSSRFFRRGTLGEGRAVLSPEEATRYFERTRTLAPADLLDWLHRP